MSNMGYHYNSIEEIKFIITINFAIQLIMEGLHHIIKFNSTLTMINTQL